MNEDIEKLTKATEDCSMTNEGTTPAADTLRPGGAPGEPKAKTLDTFVQLLAQLGQEDLSNLFNQVQSQYGPNNIPGAVDNSAQNKASVNMKESVWKEDLEVLFGDDDLSDELKEQTAVIFESAVNTRISVIRADLEDQLQEQLSELEESFNSRLEEETAEIFETVTDKLDQYIDYVIEQWMEENKIAIESSIRSDIAENFIDSLHDLFSEHYIKVPTSKLDIVADLKAENDSLKEELNSVIDKNIQLESVAFEHSKDAIISELAEGLSDVQADKLATLAEGIDFTDSKSFKKKVGILKEKYFSGSSSKGTSNLITETIGDNLDESAIEDPTIKAVANAISSRYKY